MQALLREAMDWAMSADVDAAARLYSAWFDEMERQTPPTESADPVIFSALSQLVAVWLATQHCDKCREGWASRLALLAGEASKVLAAKLELETDDVAIH